MPSNTASSPIVAARRAIEAGRLDDAYRLAAEALRAKRDDIAALEIRAVVETERGDFALAEASLRAALTAAPHKRWPYADLARLLLRMDRAADAEDVARSALIADAANPDAHAMLATLLADRGMLIAATMHFERAIALAGKHPQLLDGLGHALLRQGRLDEARPVFEAAVAADPAALLPLLHLAELDERSGDFAQAADRLDQAEPIAKAAGLDIALQRAVLLDRSGAWREALALLEAQPALSGAALLHRGRLRDRAGRHDEAWRDWTRGKARLAEGARRAYPTADVQRQAHALAGFFDKKRMSALPRAPRRLDVPQPIFILGFPRSGTTLTEQILASHSAIRAGGELPFGRDLREFAVTQVGGEDSFPDGLARMLAAEHAHWPTLWRDLYLAKTGSFGLTAPGADYFTDKMPLNDMWLPLLRLAFPESPVVLVRRHPLDILTSVTSHDLTHGFNCGYRLGDAARHLALVDDLVARYRAAGIVVTHELKYETLVADQAAETERLMAAIGLPTEAAQLRFHESERVAPTPSYAQVRAPLNARSIYRWRPYADQLAPVVPLLGKTMARGDYAA
jgi:Tfp pilus assembly protein PilF